MKALFTVDYGEERFQKIRDLGIEVAFYDEFGTKSKDFQLPPEYLDADFMVCFNPFPQIDLKQFSRLKWIQLVSVGFNHVPKEQIQTMNILLTNNVGTTRIPIAEWVVTQILQSYKQARTFTRQQQAKVWKVQKDILELYGKSVTFLGAGNIAQETARKLKSFDVNTCALRHSEKPVEFMDRVFSISEIDQILPESDIVICTLPATQDTFHLLNRERLGLMKDNSVLVNISRGSVIEELALIDLLVQGKFRAVALDVFEKEPLAADSPFWSIERVFITPHNAIFSDQSDERVYEMVYSNIKNYTNDCMPCNIVDFELGY